MANWIIAGRHFADPLPDGWRERLHTRLGQRPRRLALWAEQALFGALSCLDDAGEASLPADALLSLASISGPHEALRASLESAQDGYPLPQGFMQAQPNQVLAALCAFIGWQGEARCLGARDPLWVLRQACAEKPAGGVLLGWVEEGHPGSSCWLRLRQAGSANNEPIHMLTQWDVLADPSLHCIAVAI